MIRPISSIGHSMPLDILRLRNTCEVRSGELVKRPAVSAFNEAEPSPMAGDASVWCCFLLSQKERPRISLLI